MDQKGFIGFSDFEAIEADKVPVILVVEDDEDNRLLMKHTLTMFGWKYLFANNAIAALSLVKKRQPDLILIDIVLPYISGLQIALMLKSDRQTRSIPLIAVTGLTREQEQKQIFAAGFNDYICKPYILDDLKRAIAINLRENPYCKIAGFV